MKKIIALLLACAIALTGCKADNNGNTTSAQTSNTTTATSISETTAESSTASTSVSELTDVLTTTVDDAITDDVVIPEFSGINDPAFMQYLDDQVYSDLEVTFGSDDYVIESIDSIYISKEYLDELEYNSQSNIFFGYTLNELEEQFQGTKYVFTLGENGATTVKAFEEYDDTYERALKKIAIGAGVILICVTVSVVTAGAGAPAVCAIFAASAKTATVMALSSGAISGATAGIVKGMETGDFDEALKAAADKGSDGFMWGAITGAVVGGATKGIEIAKSGQAVSEAVANGATPQRLGAAAEEYANTIYKGETQVSYLAGEKVSLGTSGATRPDIVVKNLNGTFKAVEVKNYDLVNNLSALKTELKRQVGDRIANLPKNFTQEIALVTKGRGYTAEFTNNVVKEIQAFLFDTYGSNIPITIL